MILFYFKIKEKECKILFFQNQNMEESFSKFFEEYQIKSSEANKNFIELTGLIHLIGDQLNEHKEETFNKIATIKVNEVLQDDTVKLNIGGKIFSTDKTTLKKKIKKPGHNDYFDPHLLQGLISGIVQVRMDDENNAIFIDRDPHVFHYILNYLRSVDTDQIKFTLPDNRKTLKMLMKEANFFKLEGLNELVSYKLGYNMNSLNTFNSNIINNEEFKHLIELCNLPLVVSVFQVRKN